MFDQFLTSLLKVVIVVDILGAIAYFILGGLKQRKRQAMQQATEVETPRLVPSSESPSLPLWKRLIPGAPMPWKRRRFTRASQGDFDQLRRILYSFNEGLT